MESGDLLSNDEGNPPPPRPSPPSQRSPSPATKRPGAAKAAQAHGSAHGSAHAPSSALPAATAAAAAGVPQPSPAKTWVSSPMRDLFRSASQAAFHTGEGAPEGAEEDELSEGTDLDECSVSSDFGGDLESLLETTDEGGLEERALHAAVYVFEGENNIKFDTHPSTRAGLFAYRRVHNRVLHAMELLCTLGLLALAIFEAPSVQGPGSMLSPLWLALIEVLCLVGLSVELVLRFEWLGWRGIVRQRRTLVKLVIIAAMCVEAMVVILRDSTHLRLLRCLRPFFLADNHYSAGVRRVLRQMFQALPPIVDMLVLLLFFMFISSIFAFYLFSPNANDPYFDTLQHSFVSLFILITTANFPDVMMPSYSAHPWSFLFFLVYLIFGLYFLQNLLLAVVYDSYRDKEREKFKKLFLHRRQALRFAYRLLKDDTAGGIPYSSFCAMLRHRIAAPKLPLLHVRLFFIALNESESGVLNLAEFYRFFEANQLVWERRGKKVIPSELVASDDVGSFVALMWGAAMYIRRAVDHRYFDYIIDAVVVVNTIIMTYDAAVMTAQEADRRNYTTVRIEDVVFLAIYWLEVCMKLIGHGFAWYWKSYWHRFDLIITVVTTITMTFNMEVLALVSLRQLRVLRLFVVKARFRRVLGTILSLLPKLVSFFAALFIVFYFFAIIGAELFAGKVYPGCCGDYYSNSTTTNRYYLNNFDNIFRSFATLFELMVVNNWFVIMDGFASVTSNWARVYFMAFYIFAVIIALNVAIAFVLETFLSRMHFERTLREDVDADFIQKHIWLKKSEYAEYQRKKRKRARTRVPEDDHVWVKFVGKRKKNLDDCTMLIFKEEVAQWSEADGVLPTSLKRASRSDMSDVSALDDTEERQLIVSFGDDDGDMRNRSGQGLGEVMLRDFSTRTAQSKPQAEKPASKASSPSSKSGGSGQKNNSPSNNNNSNSNSGSGDKASSADLTFLLTVAKTLSEGERRQLIEGLRRQ